MGKITVEKPIAQQGHSLSVNITRVCHTYGIKRGDTVTVTIEHDLIPEQVEDNTSNATETVDSELSEIE